jgi:hypothetical protein
MGSKSLKFLLFFNKKIFCLIFNFQFQIQIQIWNIFDFEIFLNFGHLLKKIISQSQY